MPVKTRLSKRLARRLALGVAIAAAVPAVPVAALIVLPSPTLTFWTLAVFAREYSLLGALAALAATAAAVVSLYGPYDLAYSYDLAVPWWAAKRLSDGEGRSMLHDFIGGSPMKERDAYRAASPITYLRADVPPTLSVQGGHDQIEYPDDGRRAARLAHEAGASHRYVEIGYADHAFDLAWGGFGAQMARAEIGDFLHRTIGTG
ncbi:hypothetical protein [Microtetraspora fusca]|uniref:hypothetical protein n=1 Tax=Microtetraspora fusca TaxID=1997 RepID=UPI000AFFABF6|nr:hypothetical protein [Microtetraspora fusca]